MRGLLKEPLVQCLVGGLLLFIVVGPAEDDEPNDTILVSDDTLATYLQFRQKSFDRDKARNQLSSLSADARNRLVAEYVEEEVLYREAVALGLEDGDDIIRKRLVQKMDFLLQGFEDTGRDIGEADLKAYFEANADRYRQQARASLTHIFFSKEARGPAGAEAAAAEFAATLESDTIPPDQAGRFGDRFPYLRTYSDRPARLITEHFGSEISETIFGTAPLGEWSGPHSSPFGVHFVYLQERTDAAIPPLEAVAGAVLSDMQRDRRMAARQTALESLKAKYRILDEQESIGE